MLVTNLRCSLSNCSVRTDIGIENPSPTFLSPLCLRHDGITDLSFGTFKRFCKLLESKWLFERDGYLFPIADWKDAGMEKFDAIKNMKSRSGTSTDMF